MSRKSITIGADPEFVIINKATNQNVSANSVLHGRYTSRLGTDGHSSTGEMRPTPNKKWYKVYEDIEVLVNELRDEIGDERFKVIAGSGIGAPTGGHIHIGDREHTPRPTRIQLNNFEQWISEPLKSISNTSSRYEYGHPRDVRRQIHGYEYRTPLSWIACPTLCKGALCIAHIIGRLPHYNIETKEKLFYHAGAKERKVIDEYLKLIVEMQRTGKKIEEIDLFQAWQKKETLYCVYGNGRDYKIVDILRAMERTKFKIQVYLYGKVDNDVLSIYINPEVVHLLPVKIGKVKIVPWQIRRHGMITIGLSRKLRNEKSVAYIKGIIKKVMNILREGSNNNV